MFQVLERDGRLMPVYSRADLEYMQGRGWKVRVQQVAALLKPAEAVEEKPAKRKYTRKAKQ